MESNNNELIVKEVDSKTENLLILEECINIADYTIEKVMRMMEISTTCFHVFGTNP